MGRRWRCWRRGAARRRRRRADRRRPVRRPVRRRYGCRPGRRAPGGCAVPLQRPACRLAQHLQHPRRALDAGHCRLVVRGGLRAVHEGPDGADRDLPLLAQGRQHAFGVRDEQRRRRDDEDAARVPPSVLVEQVRGAVQGDGGLAGAGPAGHLGDGRGGRPDHQVLLGLDGGDDVAHGVAAGLPEGRHQRAVADDGQRGAVQGGGQLGAHQIVLDAEDLAALGADDPAPYDPAGVDGCRAVERRGGGRAPVDDQRRVVGVQDPDPADVQRLGDVGGVVGAYGVVGGLDGGVRAVGALLAVLAGQQVDPSEEEVLELVVEPVEVDSGPEHLRVALGERAGRADLAALGGVVHQELRLVDLLFETAVDLVEMFLLDTDLSVTDGVGPAPRAGSFHVPRTGSLMASFPLSRTGSTTDPADSTAASCAATEAPF